MDFIWQWGQPVVSSSVICVLPSHHGEDHSHTWMPQTARGMQEAQEDELLKLIFKNWGLGGDLLLMEQQQITLDVSLHLSVAEFAWNFFAWALQWHFWA